MSETITIGGDIEVVKPEEGTANGNTPSLIVDAASEHGILDIDLRGYSKADHTHEEYQKKGEAVESGLHYETIFSGDARTVGTSYSLSKPVTDYKFVIIFGAGFTKNLKRLAQKNGVWVNVEDIEFESETSGWSVIFAHNQSILGSFIDTNKFTIRAVSLDVGWEYITVTKIIGVK